MLKALRVPKEHKGYKGQQEKLALKEISDHKGLKGHKGLRELKGHKGPLDLKEHKVYKEQLEELELRVA